MVAATENHGFKTPFPPPSIATEENSTITKAIYSIPLLWQKLLLREAFCFS